MSETATTKHPEMVALRDELQREKAGLMESTAVMRKRRAELQQLMGPYEKELRELTLSINAIERPRLAEIDNQIGALSRAVGGIAMSATGE